MFFLLPSIFSSTMKEKSPQLESDTTLVFPSPAFFFAGAYAANAASSGTAGEASSNEATD
jgi:hypothetical protein